MKVSQSDWPGTLKPIMHLIGCKFVNVFSVSFASCSAYELFFFWALKISLQTLTTGQQIIGRSHKVIHNTYKEWKWHVEGNEMGRWGWGDGFYLLHKFLESQNLWRYVCSSDNKWTIISCGIIVIPTYMAGSYNPISVRIIESCFTITGQ